EGPCLFFSPRAVGPDACPRGSAQAAGAKPLNFTSAAQPFVRSAGRLLPRSMPVRPFPLAFLPAPASLAARALNALLAREGWARDRLARHAGKSVRLAVGGFTLSLTIDSDGAVQACDPAVQPDVTLTALP